MDERTTGTLFILISAAGFGTLAIFGKLTADAGLSIPTALALRFGIASCLVWPVLLGLARADRVDLRPPPRTLATALGLGALGYAGMSGLFFLALEFMPAGLTTVLLYAYPAFVVLLSAAVLDERVTRRTFVALALALAGVVLVTGGDPARADPRGVAVILGAAVVYACYIVVSRSALERIDSRVLTGYVMPAATLSFILVGLATGQLAPPATVRGWVIAAGLALVATVVPVFAFFAGLRRVGANRAGIISTAEPVVTVVLGVFLLDETVTPAIAAGGLAVLAGVYLIQTE